MRILSVLAALSAFSFAGLSGATLGAAALLSGFVAEAVVIHTFLRGRIL
jgi:hypothetical protein